MANSSEGMFYSPVDMRSAGIVGFDAKGDPIYSDDLPMGGAKPQGITGYDDNGNPVFDTSQFSAAPTTDDPGAPSPEYTEAMAGARPGGALNHTTPPAGPAGPTPPAGSNIPMANAPVGGGIPQPQIQGAMMAQQQQPEFDRVGSFLGGMASAGPAAPYAGGLQQIANLFAGGSRAVQADMAEMRKGVNQPSSVKEFMFAQGQGYEGSYMDFKKDFGGNVFGQMMQTIAMQNRQAQQTWQRAQAETKAEVAAGQREWQKSQAETKAEVAAGQRKWQKSQAETKAEVAAGQRKWQREQAERKAAIDEEERVDRRERHVVAQTQKLEKSIPVEMTDMQNALDNIRTAVAPYKVDKDGNVDLPGFGPLGGLKPGWMLGAEGDEIRATTAALRNTILKARSGGAVSDGEAARMLEELSMGQGKGEAGMLRSFNRIQEGLNDIMQKKLNAYEPEVVERYLGRPYESSPDVFEFPATLAELKAERQRRIDLGIWNPTR